MTHRRDIITVVSALTLLLCGCGGSRHTAAPAPPAQSAAAAAPSGLPSTSSPSRAAARPASTPAPPTGGPVPPGFDPVAFTAVSQRQFWLLGWAPCSRPICTSIVATSDGGAHFVGIPAPVAQVGPGAAGLDALLFADALDGYAGAEGSPADTARTLWTTHDGGARWHRARSDVLAFTVTAGHVFALTGHCAGGVCGQLALTRSPAAADGWSSVALALSSAAGIPSLTASGTSVWISLTPSSGTPIHQILLTSRDGGRTFTRGGSPCAAGLGADLEASSPAVVWATCPTGMAAGAWRSADAGAHWSALGRTGLGQELANSARIAPAGDATALLTPGANARLLRTTDAGVHFTPVAFPGAAQAVDWLGFTDARTASALVGGSGPLVGPGRLPSATLQRSADGGVRWHAVHIAG